MVSLWEEKAQFSEFKSLDGDISTDVLIIGGGMSYTFTKAQGGSVGASLLEEDYLQYALDMIKKAEEKGVKLLLPVDTIVADEFSNDANTKVVSRDAIPDPSIRPESLHVMRFRTDGWVWISDRRRQKSLQRQ